MPSQPPGRLAAFGCLAHHGDEPGGHDRDHENRRARQVRPDLVFAVVALTFFVIRLAPGDPAFILAGEAPTPEFLAQVRAENGLDKPVWQAISDLPRTRGDGGLRQIDLRASSGLRRDPGACARDRLVGGHRHGAGVRRGRAAGRRGRARCPHARLPVCAEEEPPLSSRSSAHLVACHFADGQRRKIVSSATDEEFVA
jgi:hypothetical protein